MTVSSSLQSILFNKPNEPAAGGSSDAPAFFKDLHLDQVVGSITMGWEEYDLAPFFHEPLRSPDAISYRQEVMRDLEESAAMQAVRMFSQGMRDMRARVEQANKLHHEIEKARCFLDAVKIYCLTVEGLGKELASLSLASRGMLDLREYLAAYLASTPFNDLAATVRMLETELSAIRYNLFIKDSRVSVRPHTVEVDYCAAVEQIFEKFRHGAVKDYRVKFQNSPSLNYVEQQVLDRVALLNPKTFQGLKDFCVRHSDYADEKLVRFDREVQFYVAYLAYMERFRRSGLSFCYPEVDQVSKDVRALNCFDLALADSLLRQHGTVVQNDFSMQGEERILVVSGPNQGGKTTFARLFGQLHFLASIGCPVAGTEARLFLFDHLFTHFEREEDIRNLRGRLQDDLFRIYDIMNHSTHSSIVIVNEIFSSTTLQDAVFLSRKVMEHFSREDVLGVWVTFLNELASFDQKTVSVVAMVDQDDPTLRTFKLERKPADGLSFALAIAQKHGVTYGQLLERIKP